MNWKLQGGWVFLFVLVVMLLPLSALSAEKPIHFVSGCPTPKSDAKFPSSIYKIDKSKKALVKVREVVSAEKGTEFIRPYYEEGKIVIKTKYVSMELGISSSYFALIDLDNSMVANNFKITYPEIYSDVQDQLLSIPSKGLFLAAHVFKDENNEKLLGMNLMTMKQEELSWDALKYVKVSGIPGGATPGDVFVASVKADGQIMINTTKGKIETDWKLPTLIKFKENEVVGIYVNNHEVLALSFSKSRVKKKEGLGYVPFHILDKKTNEWRTVQFTGGRTGVRGFGPWLAGYVADEERAVESPGKEKRRKVSKFPSKEDMTASGTPVDWRFEDFRIFCPGILFIYNAQTQHNYTIETGQGDSEVLLVEGDTVYYRVNDEIFEAKIAKEKVEAGKLIAKDEVVPDIHWAFFGRP